nr:carbohydrate-binding domain-containing protein [Gammaproteobacteria bacterium]
TTYYYYKVDKLSDYGSLKVVLYKTSVSSPSYTSSGCSLSTNNMMVLSLSNSTLNVSWSTYSSQSSSQFGGGPGQSQTSSSTEDSYSTKGIKSYNQITISAGTVNIKSYDDAIHANYGETLENGETGVGDVTISGGTVTVYTNDDGIHADRYLNISGGTVTVSYAYEGLEATVINISGGTTTVYSTDDGTNSSQKVSGITVSTNISGGILDITVYGNDVDGIDSNGNYIQTGGTVITRGYGNGGLSTGMDCDGTVSMTGGILVCFGNKPETYSTIKTSSGVKTGSSSSTYSAKTYTIKSSSASVSTTNKYSYSGMYYWSYDGTISVS